MQTEIFEEVAAMIESNGFTVVSSDFNRPWGGFFVLDEKDADRFILNYFPNYTKEQLMIGEKLSPKFLVVAPNKRLSWQYHFRRAEIWRVLSGPVKVATNLSDEEVEPKTYHDGDIIVLQKGERHRLIGDNNYGIVAEIWQHTDPARPSDEDDIIRLQDDFGR
jgi:mannose-6-phosphate isomerase